MKTITDIKKAMEPGTSWHTVRLLENGDVSRDYGVRSVVLANTTGAYLRHKDDKAKMSFFGWPQRSMVEFLNNDSFTVKREGYPVLIYTLVRES